MIETLLNLLTTDNHYNVSERVEIAKGKYEFVSTWKDAFTKIKRHWKYGK